MTKKPYLYLGMLTGVAAAYVWWRMYGPWEEAIPETGRVSAHKLHPTRTALVATADSRSSGSPAFVE